VAAAATSADLLRRQSIAQATVDADILESSVSSDPVRLGVAGLGGMGLVHARNASALTGVELVAVAAARPGRAAEVAAELSVVAATYEELVEREDVDAVVVAARSVDHAEVAAAVLAAGKHLFLEKPGATSLAGHDRLRVGEGLVVQLGYQRRFDAAFVEARRRVEEGAIGQPLLVLATSRDMEWPPGELPQDTGGFLLDMAVHDYDVACWFLGGRPVEVSALRQARVHPGLEALGDLDNALVTLRFDDGGAAVTHVSRTCAFGHDVRCEVVGSEGSVFIGTAAGVLTAHDRARFPQDFRERFADAYRDELAAFVEACRGGERRGAGLQEDRRAVEIGIAARASAVAGEPRAVGSDWPWP
jgi:scyllo-inositol 2-dehydrogenase (NAD+)